MADMTTAPWLPYWLAFHSLGIQTSCHARLCILSRMDVPVCHVPETQISLVARTGRMRNISYPVSLYSVCPMRLPPHILFWSGQPNCSALESMASVHCTFLDYVPIDGWAGGVAGFCGFEWGPNGQRNCRQSRKWDDNVITWVARKLAVQIQSEVTAGVEKWV